MSIIIIIIITAQEVQTAPEDLFDHSAQHCRDVSIWGDVRYRDEACEKCETDFEQICEDKVETVCEQVPETSCTLVLYTDCRLFMEETPYNSTEVVPEAEYHPWECSNFTQEEIHVKLVPRCHKRSPMPAKSCCCC